MYAQSVHTKTICNLLHTSKPIKLLILLILAGTLLVSPLKLYAANGIKVHKNRIIVSPPDKQNQVMLYGTAAAIESKMKIRAYVINLRTKTKTPIQLHEDGGFKVIISACVDDLIRVIAKTNSNVQSYGTFTVPAGAGNIQTDNAAINKTNNYNHNSYKGIGGNRDDKNTCNSTHRAVNQNGDNKGNITNKISKNNWYNQPANQTDITSANTEDTTSNNILPNVPGTDDKMGLAVIITVVNTKTGKIVAAERIAGISRARSYQPELYAAIVNNIIKRCKSVIRAELQRRQIRTHQYKQYQNNTKTNNQQQSTAIAVPPVNSNKQH